MVWKECKNCGAEIHPLKTEYSSRRTVCDSCIRKGNAIRRKKCYIERRIVSRGLGLTTSLENCFVCGTKVPPQRSRYCANQCMNIAKRTKSIQKSLARIPIRRKSLLLESRKLKLELKNMRTIVDKKKNAL